MQLPRQHLNKVYRYLKLHDGQTLLVKNIARDTSISRWTVARDLKWLEKRGIIKREGKNFFVLE